MGRPGLRARLPSRRARSHQHERSGCFRALVETMRPSATRQWAWGLALIGATAGTVLLHAWSGPRVPRLGYLSGWALFLLMLVLTAFNARKRLPFVPLLSSRAWLEFHVYGGVFATVLFGLHLHGRAPTGT